MGTALSDATASTVKALGVTIVVAIVIGGCQRSAVPRSEPMEIRTMRSALRVVEREGLFAKRVNASALSRRIDQLAQSPHLLQADSRDFILDLITATGDRHGRYLPPSGPGRSTSDEAPSATRIELEVMSPGDGIALLVVPTVRVDPNSPDARSILDAARTAFARPACGWIVDLRQDMGGDLLTQLSILEPLLNDGVAITYRSFRGSETIYSAQNRFVSVSFGAKRVAAPRAADPAPQFSGPVAVLLGAVTQSAGEGLAVALKNRGGSRSFGRPTLGAPTATGIFPLPDGSSLQIATQAATTATGVKLIGPIEPDVTSEDDVVVSDAVKWLRSSPECRTFGGLDRG